MKDRSQLAMLVGLIALAIVAFQFFPSFSIHGIFHGIRGVLPWLLFAFFTYLLFGKGGCCGKRSCSKEESSS
jgi:hypothetical protein